MKATYNGLSFESGPHDAMGRVETPGLDGVEDRRGFGLLDGWLAWPGRVMEVR